MFAFVDRFSNTDLPLEVYEEYFRWIDRAKSDLMNAMIMTSDVVKPVSQKLFNDTLTDMWNDQHRL